MFSFEIRLLHDFLLKEEPEASAATISMPVLLRGHLRIAARFSLGRQSEEFVFLIGL